MIRNGSKMDAAVENQIYLKNPAEIKHF